MCGRVFSSQTLLGETVYMRYNKPETGNERGYRTNMHEYQVTINGLRINASYTAGAVNGIFLPLLKKVSEMQQKKGERILILLAAPPGAGKSTLASFLEQLAKKKKNLKNIQAIGMDGFHRRQEYLMNHSVQRDGEQIPMVQIKGAPITFDLERLAESVKRVSAGDLCGWPVYDRLLHNPKEDGILVDGDIVFVEGNYLLLDEPGWRELKQYADYSISIRAEENMLRTRLITRRIQTGVDRESATTFVDFSDMPNVRLCLQKTAPADLELQIDPDGDYRIISGGWHESN